MSTGSIYISGVIGEDITDIDVIRQVKSLGEITDLNVYITSPGGSVDVGFAIYNYLKTLPVNVNTFARGNCDSIATVIFQAGAQRHVEESIHSFVIHNTHISLFDSVDANDLARLEKQLRKEEDKITSFYSKKTGLNFTTLDKLMDREANLSSAEVVDLGFADGSYSELKAAAQMNIKRFLKQDNKITPDMNIEQKITALYNKLIGKTDPKNIFFLKLADGTEAYVDSADGDFLGKRIVAVENGNITDTPLADGAHELAVGGMIMVEGGAVTAVERGSDAPEAAEEEAPAVQPEAGEDTEIETNENNTTMNEEELKAFISAQVAEAFAGVSAKMDEEKELLFTENQKKTEALEAERKEVLSELRTVVTTFNMKGNEKREPDADLLGVASSDNIRAIRAMAKNKKK